MVVVGALRWRTGVRRAFALRHAHGCDRYVFGFAASAGFGVDRALSLRYWALAEHVHVLFDDFGVSHESEERGEPH